MWEQRALKEVTRTFRRHPLHRRIRWTVSKIVCAFVTDGQHWFAAPEPRYPGASRTHRRCRICGGRLIEPAVGKRRSVQL